MIQTKLFEELGAPLCNPRWSWGAIRKSDGAIFLRVWEDQKKMLGGKTYIRLTHKQFFKQKARKHPGNEERLKHINLLKKDYVTFMIMCIVKRPITSPRVIDRLAADKIYCGGTVKEIDGDVWLEIKRTISFEEAKNSLKIRKIK